MIYLRLFWEFFKIGLFTFGGGYAMIPLVKETVLKFEWLAESEFYDFLGICESTPGPIAINMATYVGSTQANFLGAVVATLGVVLPSFIIILLIAMVLKKVIKNKYVGYALNGIKAVVLGLIISTGLILLSKSIGYVSLESFKFSIESLIIVILIATIYFVFLKFKKKKLNTIAMIAIAACLGLIICPIFA